MTHTTSIPPLNNNRLDGCAHKDFATATEMAQRYEVSLRTVRRWTTEKKLVYIKIKSVVRYEIAACDLALFGQTNKLTETGHISSEK